LGRFSRSWNVGFLFLVFGNGHQPSLFGCPSVSRTGEVPFETKSLAGVALGCLLVFVFFLLLIPLLSA